MAKSHPVKHQQAREDSIFASMYKPAAKHPRDKKQVDFDFVNGFHDSLNSLYKSEAVSEVGERHSYLNLSELKYRKNPDITKTINDLGVAIEMVKHRPLLDKTKITKSDIKILVKKLKEKVKNDAEE